MTRVVLPTSRGTPLSFMTMGVMVASQDSMPAREMLIGPNHGIQAGPLRMNDQPGLLDLSGFGSVVSQPQSAL